MDGGLQSNLAFEYSINLPYALFLWTDLASGIHAKQFSDDEAEKISAFLERAYMRLNSWFQWFNSTQSGKLYLFHFNFLYSLTSVWVGV